MWYLQTERTGDILFASMPSLCEKRWLIMDYKKLSDDLLYGCQQNCADCEYAGDHEFECTITKLASSAIANLLIENQALRNAANGFKERAEAAGCELEQKDIYYDQIIDAFAAMDSADLEATKTKLRMPAADVSLVVHETPIFKIRPERYERYDEYGLNENGEMLYVRRILVDEKSYAMYCPSCGKRLCSRFTNYCPNCGAKMDR